VSFKDQVFKNIALRGNALSERTKRWISRKSVAGAARLENYRVNARPGIARFVEIIQGRVETAIILTSKHLRTSSNASDPCKDPEISLRLARGLVGVEAQRVPPQVKQTVITSFGGDYREAKGRRRQARNNTVSAYHNYNGCAPKADLKRQKALAERWKELAEKELSIAVRCKVENSSGIDRIRTARLDLAQIESEIAAMTPDRAVSERLERAQETLALRQQLSPAAAKFELAELKLNGWERELAVTDDVKARRIRDVQVALHRLQSARNYEGKMREIWRVANSGPRRMGRNR
jgi:hypothetical protein